MNSTNKLIENLNEKRQKELLDFLCPFVHDKRLNLFKECLNQRTNFISVVLEDIYQSQNASAVLRSCECVGVQDVYIIERTNEYSISPDVAVGSNKWLGLNYAEDSSNKTLDTYTKLRKKGYKIVATCPNKDAVSMQELSLEEPIALVFGTELTGLTQEAIDNADYTMYIPMSGFTESFNISVAAAISLYYLTSKLRLEPREKWGLDNEKYNKTLIKWLRDSIRCGDQLVKNFIEENKINNV